MATKSVLLETSATGIATITLNRPGSLNALNVNLLNELVDALRLSLNARVIILQGAGDRAFCAGEDLRETLAPRTGSAEELRHAFEKLQDLTRLMASSPALVITAVQGYAVGGGAEIALTGDFVIGGHTARFRFPEVVIGHAATGGITQRLPVIVGLLKAKELLLTGRVIGAEEAQKIGMLSEIAENPKARAWELAQMLAALPKTAASSSKLSLERAVFPNQEAVLQDEISTASLCFAQHDAAGAFSNFASRKGNGGSPHLPPPEDLNTALAAAVKECPSKTFLRFGGTDHTFESFDTAVAHMAGALRLQGVEQDDRVLVVMKNSVEMVQSWFATNRLGAVWAPINPESKSKTLKHVMGSVKPKLALVHADHLETIKAAGILTANEIFCVGSSPPGTRMLPDTSERITKAVPVSASTTSALLFTSGTSGPSKPCILPHGYFIRSAQILVNYLGLQASDVLYCPFPLFHVDATALTIVPALLLRTVAALSVRYSASKFWDEIRATHATVYDFMGATLALTYKQPPSPKDRDHSVRLAWGVPVPAWSADYESRFNHPIFELYGSCESGLPVVQQGARVPGSCGRAVPGYSLRIAGPSGHPLPPNTVGDLLVRADHPNAIFRGYYGDPRATVEAFADSWLHTGDRARLDARGNLFYVGRSKDMIRRRGENVNAFEVEEELLAHPDVLGVAAFAVPASLGEATEDDIKVAVVVRREAVAERGFSEAALWEWAGRHMARFQVPDVVEFVGGLERTRTGKVERHSLKKEGGKRFPRKKEVRRVSKM